MAAVRSGRGTRRLQRGARGRYAPPPQLFPLVLGAGASLKDTPLAIERDEDGTYLVRHRITGRLMARTADPATLQRLISTLGGA